MKPQKWKLGDIFTLQMGKTPDRDRPEYWEDGEFAWASIADLSNCETYLKTTKEKISVQAVNATKIKKIPAGTLLMSFKLSVGKTAIAKNDCYSNEAIMAFIDKQVAAIDIKYIYHLFSSINWELGKNRAAKGITLNKKILSETEIFLPPLSEQKRIAAILDKVDGIIRKRKQSLKLLDELVKAKFVEMFGDLETNEKGWEILNLNDAAEIKIGPFGSMLHQADYIQKGYPVINPSNILYDEIIPDMNITITEDKYNSLLPYKLEIGDIVLGRRGEMGRCAVVKSPNMICGTGCVNIRLKDRFEPDFIQFILSSPLYKKLLSAHSVGITMQNLNMDILAGLPIYNIPHTCQKDFILISSNISIIKMQQNLSIQESENIKASLIKQFFTLDM